MNTSVAVETIVETLLDTLVDAARAQEREASAEADTRFYRVYSKTLRALVMVAKKGEK